MGIIHRDVKTQNLLIDQRNKYDYNNSDYYFGNNDNNNNNYNLGLFSSNKSTINVGYTNVNNNNNNRKSAGKKRSLGRYSCPYIIRICDFGSARAMSKKRHKKHTMMPQTGPTTATAKTTIGGAPVADYNYEGDSGFSPRGSIASNYSSVDSPINDISHVSWQRDILHVFRTNFKENNNKDNSNEPELQSTSQEKEKEKENKNNDVNILLLPSESDIKIDSGMFVDQASILSDNNNNGNSIYANMNNWIDNQTLTEMLKERTNGRRIYRKSMSTLVGSIQFLAPEILTHFKFNQFDNSDINPEILRCSYDYTVDIYSFGCVLWEIIHHSIIYNGWTFYAIHDFIVNSKQRLNIENQMFDHIENGIKCPKIVKKFIISLINLCWNENQYMRPDFREIALNTIQVEKNAEW